MKTKILALIIIIFAAIVNLMGSQGTEEKNNQGAKGSIAKARPDSQAVRASLSDEWQIFKSESEQKIQENEKSIAVFKEKIDKSGTKLKAKLKANYNKEIENLEIENSAMKRKLDNFKNNGKSVWEDFKIGFNKDMDKLGKALKDLTSDKD